MNTFLKPLFIFDLDGTISLIDHRRSVLDDLSNSNRWNDFYNLCDKDIPNKPVICVMEQLYFSGNEIWIFSGRSMSVFDKTKKWLKDNILYLNDKKLVRFPFLRMRPIDDYTPDEQLKLSWFQSMKPKDKQRLVAIFDDRDKVVKMWREQGISCFQVAEGGF